MGVKEYNFLIGGLSKILDLNEKINLNNKKKASIEQLIVENKSVNEDLRDELKLKKFGLNKVIKDLKELENISIEYQISELKELQTRCANMEMEYSFTPEVNNWVKGRIDEVKAKRTTWTGFINIAILPIILILVFTGPLSETGSDSDMACNILLQCCILWPLLMFTVSYIGDYFKDKSVSKIGLDWSSSDDKKDLHVKQTQRGQISQIHAEIAKLENGIERYEKKKITFTEEKKSTEELIIEIEIKLKTLEQKLFSKHEKLLLTVNQNLKLKKQLNEIFNSIDFLIPKK